MHSGNAAQVDTRQSMRACMSSVCCEVIEILPTLKPYILAIFQNFYILRVCSPVSMTTYYRKRNLTVTIKFPEHRKHFYHKYFWPLLIGSAQVVYKIRLSRNISSELLSLKIFLIYVSYLTKSNFYNN